MSCHRSRIAALCCATVLYCTDSSNSAEPPSLTVTTTQDVADSADQRTSLREAILYANTLPGEKRILFQLPASESGPQGTWILKPASALPAVTSSNVVIDGLSQTGSRANGDPGKIDAAFVVELDGSAAGTSASGLIVQGSQCAVQGLIIRSFGQFGVSLESTSTGSVVRSCFIGTDAAGLVARGNLQGGVQILGPANRVGGSQAADRNLISGNKVGILLKNSTAKTNIIQGNFLGTDVSGSAPLPNTTHGIQTTSSPVDTWIGGDAPGQGNLIAFNLKNGLLLGSGERNRVWGNSIFSNKEIGIDLSNDGGVTPNDAGDADGGSNLKQNFPVLDSAQFYRGAVSVAGTLSSQASKTYHLEFFLNPSDSPEEGRLFLGFGEVKTDASGNGSFQFSFPAAYQGNAFVTSIATDPLGNSSEFGPSVALGARPSANPDQFTTLEDTPVEMELLANDASPDADPVFLSALSEPPTHGAASILANGRVRYVPNADFAGSDRLVYSITNAHGGTDQAAVELTVTPVNDPPVALAQAIELNEDEIASIVLAARDPDTSPENLEFEIVTRPLHGTVDQQGARVAYHPAANFSGNDRLEFRVRESGSETFSAPGEITLSIVPVNDPPSALESSWTGNEDEPFSIELQGRDVEGGPLTFSILDPPRHGKLSGNAPRLLYTPEADFFGSDSFTFQVADAGQGSSPALSSAPARVSLTIIAGNDPPFAGQAGEPELCILPDRWRLPKNRTAVRCLVDAAQNSIALWKDSTGYGLLLWLPDGTLAWDRKLSDLQAQWADLQEASNGDFILAGSQLGTGARRDGIVVRIRKDGVEAWRRFVSSGDFNELNALAMNPVGDVLVAGTTMNATADFIICKLTGAGDTAWIRTFDTPEGAADIASSIACDKAGNIFVSGTGVSPSHSGLVTLKMTGAGGVIWAQLFTSGQNPAASRIELADDGSLLVASSSGSPGSRSLSVLRYASGANAAWDSRIVQPPDSDLVLVDTAFVRGRLMLLASATKTQNTKAWIASIDPSSLTASWTTTVEESGGLTPQQLLSNDSGEALVLGKSGPSAFPRPAAFLINRNGLETSRLVLDFHESPASPGIAAPIPGGWRIPMIPASTNQAAELLEMRTTPWSQRVEGLEDQPLEFLLNAGDPDGNPLTIEILNPPAHAQINQDGLRFRLVPEANFAGGDRILVRVSDGSAWTPPCSVRIDWKAVNDPPRADAYEITLAEDESAAFQLSGSDADSDALQFEVVQGPGHGNLTGTPPRLSYRPAPNFYGEDELLYRARDASTASPPASVRFHVTSVNDFPIFPAPPAVEDLYAPRDATGDQSGASHRPVLAPGRDSKGAYFSWLTGANDEFEVQEAHSPEGNWQRIARVRSSLGIVLFRPPTDPGSRFYRVRKIERGVR